jgi:hypothetical protein
MEKTWRRHRKGPGRPQVFPRMLNGGRPAATLAFVLRLRGLALQLGIE